MSIFFFHFYCFFDKLTQSISITLERCMKHKPIEIRDLSFELPHRPCFSGFSTQIQSGDRIAIIGRNGAGKSSLLKMIMGEIEPSSGTIMNNDRLVIGYVPQTVLDHADLSGGERFNEAFTDAISEKADLLILDEPTNHLDQKTRYSLMRMLDNYQGTILFASHDITLINQCATKLWHIDNGKITVFSGTYDDYMQERQIFVDSTEKRLNELRKEKKKLKEEKIKELKKSAQQGKQKPKDNEKLNYNNKASRAQATSDARISTIKKQMESVSTSLNDQRLPEVLMPSFILTNARTSLTQSVLSVSQGVCGYPTNQAVVSGISFSMYGTDKISLSGNNGSGKTTIIRGIMQDPCVVTSGLWQLPRQEDIGYIDQHYGNLDPEKTVEDTIYEKNRTLSRNEIRKHLNGYLFRKNEEVYEKVRNLSGGEKARLSLAQVAANPPKLLILDEITNNVDIETKQYIVEVLSQYPGAFIVISHESDFLKKLPLTERYVIDNGVFHTEY